MLDECITKRIRHLLKGHSVATVSEMGWLGTKNGELLSLASQNSFDVFLTIDKGIIHQQNIKRYPISIVVLNSNSSRLEELEKFIPNFLTKISQMIKNNFYVIEA